MENNKNKRNLNSCLYYIFLYAPLGAVCPLIGQYLSSIGFTGTQVGIVTSCATAAAVLGGLIMGKVYANANIKRLVIAIMLLISAICTICAMHVKTFLFFTLIYSVLYFFQQPIQSFSDSMVIQNGQNFALIRAFGAIGYAVTVYFAGLLADNKGLQVIFIIHAISTGLAAITMLREKEPPHYSEKKERISAIVLFKNKKFVKLIICSFFVMGTIMGNNTYFGYLYRDAGGDISGIGLCFLLMAGSEALFMPLLPLARRKLPMQKLIAVGLGVCVFRFGLNALGPSTGVLIGTFFLQGIMDAIILVELIRYFEMIVEPKFANLSVSTFYALGNNFSAIVCSIIGGAILDAFSAKAVYLFFTIMCAISLTLYIVFGLAKNSD